MHRIKIIIALSCFLSSQSFNEINEILYDPSNWVFLLEDENGLRVYNKSLEYSDIPAVLVEYETVVDYEVLKQVILNGELHPNFMEESHLIESVNIKVTNEYIDNYQRLSPPFLTDRHYVTRTHFNIIDPSFHIRLNWKMLPNISEYQSLIEKKNAEFGNAIYMDYGYGGWEIIKLSNNMTQVNYRIIIDPGGWIPDFLVTQSNAILAPITVLNMVREAQRQMNP